MTILLFTIGSGLEILGQLPSGVVGVAYTATLTARGGLAPYTMAVLSALPAGLTATDNGDGSLTIAGEPSEPWSEPVTVQLTDGLGRSVRRRLSLVVLPEVVGFSYLLLKTGDFLLLKSGFKLRLKNG